MDHDGWAAHVAATTAHLDGDPRLEGVDLVIEQRIVEDDTVRAQYHISLRDGSAAVVDGPAESPDVIIEQDTETAKALRSGELHAQGAFLTGRLRIDGDVQKLVAHRGLLAELVRATNA